MKFTGEQEFTGNVSVNKSKTYDSSVLNKFNVPLHKPLEGEEFGDVFSASNALNFVDNEGNINLLLDIDNDDILKSILVSEHMFDDFYNYGSEFNTSSSFHDDLEVNTVNFLQHQINGIYTMTATHDSTVNKNVVELIILDDDESTSFYNNVNKYISSGLPIHVTFINNYDSTTLEKMIVFDNIFIDTNIIKLEVSNKLSSWFKTITTCDQIKLETFIIVDNIKTKNVVKLPLHHHSLNDISDIATYTNVKDGYIKLNGKDLRLPIEN